MFGLFKSKFRNMNGHFRSHVWDPKLLSMQIIAMTCQFYFVFGVWIYLMDLIGKFDASIDQLFTQTDLNLLEDSGRVQIIAFLLNSLTSISVFIGGGENPVTVYPGRVHRPSSSKLANVHIMSADCSSIALWYIVQRTKLCLDFAVTTHVFHFIGCWIYSGHIPQTLSWWILNIIGCALMTVCGEFLCMRTEMKAIPLTMAMGPKVDL